ncbi:MAG TPA: ATP-binding protein [Kofleriaceae bacterium]|nr:ATP-binding protein [Kofleriaceae bacterium]
MNSARLGVSIPSEFSQVRLVGAALRGVLTDLGCGEEQLVTIELCAVEAINNVIEHAYKEQAGHQVRVQLAVRERRLELTVSDDGAAMPDGALDRVRAALRARDSGEEEALVLGQVAEGGYGLGLILQTMDEVSYQREAGHNTLQMSLRLEPGATAVASGADLAAGADLGDPAAATNTEDPPERRGR